MIIGISGKIGSGKSTVCQMIKYIKNVHLLNNMGITIGNTYQDYKKFNNTVSELVTVPEIIEGNEKTNVLEFYEERKMAGLLKEFVATLTNIPLHLLDDQAFKETHSFLGYTYRQLLQQFGNKAREIDENIWVKYLLREYNKYEKFRVVKRNWIISDIRYKNEFDICDVVYRVNRLGVKEVNRIEETELDNTDFNAIIDNNGTLEELFNTCYKLL